MTQTFRRRKKLIQPRFQLRLIGYFVGLAVLGILLQFLLLGFRIMSAAERLEGGGGQLAEEVPGMLLQVLAFSLAALLPIFFGFGILFTFRIAGPIYRFEKYLLGVASGEQVGPCKIRTGDELQPLCDAINAATEPLRRRTERPDAVQDSDSDSDSEPEPVQSAG